MYKWNTYIKLSWITIIIDVFISIYLYIFGKELKHIWNTDDNIVIKSFNVLSYAGYLYNFLLGIFSIIGTGYLLVKIIQYIIHSGLDDDDGTIIIIQIIILVLLLLILGYLLYNPIIIALLVCIGVAFGIISMYS